MNQIKGKASIQFERPPVIVNAFSVVGKKEGDGPLGALFDRVAQDDMFGKDNWEQAESAMQKEAAAAAIKKAGLTTAQIRYLFAGDLLGQLIATSFGTGDLEIPLFGLLHHRRSPGAGGHDRKRSLRRLRDNPGFQSFCYGGKAVPVPLGLRQPASHVSHLDGDGLRCSGAWQGGKQGNG